MANYIVPWAPGNLWEETSKSKSFSCPVRALAGSMSRPRNMNQSFEFYTVWPILLKSRCIDSITGRVPLNTPTIGIKFGRSTNICSRDYYGN